MVARSENLARTMTLSLERNVASLTEHEVRARNSPGILAALADGHAAQYDEGFIAAAWERMPEFARNAATIRDYEADDAFRTAYMNLTGQFFGLKHPFKLQPHATASIGNVMALCKLRRWRLQLLEPAFDNIALKARELGVELLPLPEEQLLAEGERMIDTETCDAVMLVAPNNPTGVEFPILLLERIAARCAEHGLTLIIDASFRAYDGSRADHYAIVEKAGCSWIIIEDTGKLLATHELKASLISCSRGLRRDLFEIVEVDVLGVSKVTLQLLTHLLLELQSRGLEVTVHRRVQEARQLIREACRGTILRPARGAEKSTLPVEWLEITDDRYDDNAIVAHLAHHGLAALPGRQFFWSSAGELRPRSRYIRLSLLKPRTTIETGVRILRSAILALPDPI